MRLEVGIGVIVLMLAGIGVHGIGETRRSWAAYAAAQHCVVTGEVMPESIWSDDGKAIYTTGQITYQCDGGEVVTR